MKVGEFQEQNDGSAIVELEMNREEQNIFINHAVNDILRKQLGVKPRVLITIEGGNIQDVCCDDGTVIEIVELDFDREETHLINRYDCREDTKMIDKTIKEYDRDRFETKKEEV